MNPLRSVWMALALWAATAGRCHAVEVIEAWSYYLAPPFRMAGAADAGLSHDLVAYLNRALKDRYEVRLVHLPRSRLDMMLETEQRAIVMFAPSVLYGTPRGDKYLWSQALLKDSQELISRADAPFQFENVPSLKSVRFAGLRGHLYPAIERELAAARVDIQRYNTESSLFSMLQAGRVDVVTAANSTYRHLVSQQPELASQLVLSRKNLGAFTRHLMFMRGMSKARDDFDAVIRRMPTDPEWIGILRQYDLEPAR